MHRSWEKLWKNFDRTVSFYYQCDVSHVFIVVIWTRIIIIRIERGAWRMIICEDFECKGHIIIKVHAEAEALSWVTEKSSQRDESLVIHARLSPFITLDHYARLKVHSCFALISSLVQKNEGAVHVMEILSLATVIPIVSPIRWSFFCHLVSLYRRWWEHLSKNTFFHGSNGSGRAS